MKTLMVSVLFVALAALAAGCTMVVDSAQAATEPVMPEAAQWDTWVLDSASELRPEAPPDAQATAAELAEVQAILAANDAEALANVAYWDAGTPTYRWLEFALAEYGKGPPSGAVSRGLALLNVAIYDAIVASWDAKYEYDRPRPSSVNALVDVPSTDRKSAV